MGEVLGIHWQDQDGYHIDVSQLSPPEPMVAIVQLIEEGKISGPIIVHHNRLPVHLFPELHERGWTHQIISNAPQNIVLRLLKEK